MKKAIRFFSAAVLAAFVAMAGTSCQKETNVEAPEETVDVPEAASGIHVTVGAGIVDTKSLVVMGENNRRTLTFTSGDKLFVKGSLTLDLGEGNVACTLSGNLAVKSIEVDGTNATFEGDLTLYKGDDAVSYNFGQDNPLDLCTSARALLVHEGSTLLGESYFERIAPTVKELMETCLNVSGGYDQTTQSFSLSAAGTSGDVIPIFNCNIGGLEHNTLYEVYLLIGDDADDASGDMLLGGIQSNGLGEATFACYTSISATKPYYYALRFKNGNDWMRAELGTKQLESKVYNITRTASTDPASPVAPTVTGSTGTWNPDLSVSYQNEADITISGNSRGYYFVLNAGGTVHLDNLSASVNTLNPFIESKSAMNIELTGDNSIRSEQYSCIEVFGTNDIRLSCSGSSATLSLTYKDGVEGISANNSELAETGYNVALTTVQNSDGTWTSTYTVTHTGLLTGQFTINASGDKVRFSQGNLRYCSATYPGQGTWSFAPHQYSIIGNDENNTYTSTASVGKSMDLFCWGATGLVDSGAIGAKAINPDVNFNNSDPDDPDPYYYSVNSNLSGIYEWGNVAISNTTLTNSGSEKWRTLTKDEWEYLFSNNAKYGPATVAEHVGIVLLPDSFSDPGKNGGSGAFVSVKQKTGATYNDNVYSAENWKAMEYAGAVFLPAGGIFYKGTFGYSSSDMGHYWTSTPNTNGDTKAYFFVFYHNVCEVRSGDTNSGDSGVYRSSRLSVRLVRE